MSSQSGAPKPNHDPSYALGDLELAPRPSRASAQVTRGQAADSDATDDDELTNLAPTRGSLPGLDGFDRSNDLEALEGDAHADPFADDRSFELDLGPGEQPGRPSLPNDRRSLPAEARMSLPANANSGAPSASGRVPSSPSFRDEERAAKKLADYGEPTEGFGAPGYVVRVARRWVRLYLTRREVEQRASERADAYEKALRDLGRALLDDAAVTQHEALRERVLLVRTREGERASAEQATRDAEARAETELKTLKQKSVQLEEELAPYQQAAHKAEQALAKLDAELKRKKAKLQRAEIELRAFGRASVPPPTERVQQIENERQAEAQEITALTTAQSEASAALSRAHRELVMRRGAFDASERTKAEHERRVRMKSHAFEEEVSRAEHALGAALCALAEAADALGLAHSAQLQVASLRETEKTLDDTVDELARYDRALTVYDRGAFAKGALMWLALLVVIYVIAKIL